MARPPSRWYEFQKTVRRHKFGFAAAAGLILALAVGVLASTWQAVRATRAEQRSAAALDELRATAPAFAEQARALAARERFAEAIEKLDYALKLRPDAAEFQIAKGDLLLCQLKLAEAANAYREALRVKPGVARAEASAKLCDELLASRVGADGKLSRESLARLHLALQQQQRPAAELMPVARLLGEENKLVVDYWLARLKDLPVSAERPLDKRLTVRDDGRLALDLSDTKVTDLSPLADAPLAVLDVSSCTELSDLSALRGINLIELNISGTGVADLTPLREVPTLEKLEMSGTKVSNLAALSGLRLRVLNFQGCPVSDLNPIRQMPLEEMVLRGTRVADLSPLIGMPIKIIDLSMAPVLDFSPLAQLPLEKCYLQRNRITDLTVLRDKPLKELLLWGCVEARNYAAITGINTLELLLLPSEYRDLPTEDYEAIGSLRNHPRLRQLGSEIMAQMDYAATGSKDVFWQDWDREQSFVPGLRAQKIKFSLTKLPVGTYLLVVENQPLRDLSILAGAPISELVLYNCPFSDLTPIHDLKLERLQLSTESVADLSPLRGLPLKTLYLMGSKISDLSPLRDLPLREVYLEGCANVTDVAVLAEIPTLEKVTVPVHARNVEALQKLAKLQMLAFKRNGNSLLPDSTAADFWKDIALNPLIGRLRGAGIKASAIKRLADGTWEVSLEGSSIHDLSTLQGVPISELTIGNTPVTDLSPLRGMPLKVLRLYNTTVRDLTPLQGMALAQLNIKNTQVTDISVLRGMPLDDLRLADCEGIIDLSPLADSKQLRNLSLPPNAKAFEFLRNFPKLQLISYRENPQDAYNPDMSAAQFWRAYDANPWIARLSDAGVRAKSRTRQEDGTWTLDLSGIGDFKDLTPLKGAPIGILYLNRTAVADLSPLRGMPLKWLDLAETKVTDLSPLQGMPLESLNVYKTKVSDLAALRGMPIKFLYLGATGVTNLEPLRGMPLRILELFGTTITNLGPLRGMALENLWLGYYSGDLSALRGMPLEQLKLHDCAAQTDFSPLASARELASLTLPVGAKNIEFLRAFPKLERIAFEEDWKNGGRPSKTAEEFWREYDAKKK